MTAPKVRNFLLALGLLVATFGIIYAFTPGGFSWQLELAGLLLIVPWLVFDHRRSGTARVEKSGVPRWHPESAANDG